MNKKYFTGLILVFIVFRGIVIIGFLIPSIFLLTLIDYEKLFV